MARVSVQMPTVLSDDRTLSSVIAGAAATAMDAELPSVLGEIVRDGEVPANRGVLRAAVAAAAQPARILGDQVVAGIVVAGEASAYAAVQDLGRRAGRPMSWRHLYYGPGAAGRPDGWRTGWTNRARRDWVLEVAASLAQRDAERPKRTTGKAKSAAERRSAYERRACYLLSVSIASAIRSRGMKGRRFIDGNRQKIADRVRELVVSEIEIALRGTGLQ